MLFKIYFWLFLLFSSVGIVSDLALGHQVFLTLIEMASSILGFLGLYGYLYNRLFFNKISWQVIFVVVIVIDILFAIMIQKFQLMTVLGFIPFLPAYYGLYKYANKFPQK